MAEMPGIGRAVGILCNRISRQMRAPRHSGEITRVQGNVLHYIMREGGERDVFQRDIETAFEMRPPSASGLIRGLEERNLLRRESVESDARLKRLVITERAARQMNQIRENIEALEARMVRGIAREELDTFLRVVDKMIENLK